MLHSYLGILFWRVAYQFPTVSKNYTRIYFQCDDNQNLRLAGLVRFTIVKPDKDVQSYPAKLIDACYRYKPNVI
ncbi:hypothetical protein PR001_g31108 [Phytophthora rubi]|uniref:Uncharacterized protein n=1 Tax=Phytophthora rubi TaxID=129364 RepID=A0A6A3GL17_9STRA|nr:hypothetical protein PR002_g30969 [Phytophthora rubi]KAE8958277.1 hypothetical protein PR001_g31108 [Phytophthora rubi]